MFLVTGISRGLGKAIVEELLKKNKTVVGIGRSHSFVDENFSFIQCDFSNPMEVDSITLPRFSNKITLINNAGILGEIKRISDQEISDLPNVMQVNVFAPMQLLKKAYQNTLNKDLFTVVNVSSGAASRAIPSWASYCASKAALNMLTETFLLEENEKNNHPIVYALSPGVIDTGMQEQIRSASEKEFSAVENFRKMKEENALFSPKEAAERLLKLLELPYNQEVLADLRQVD